MKNKFLILSIVVFAFFLISTVSAARMPTVGGDDDSWGTVLNTYLNVSLNETGELRANNLTLGNKITFALGEVIDNLVDGWITVTGMLNVTENATLGDVLFVNKDLGRVGIGTTSVNFPFHVNTSAGDLNTMRALIGDETGSNNIFFTGAGFGFAYGTNANAIGYINYNGYQGGANQYRDLWIGDGRTGNVMYVDGDVSRVGIGTITPQQELNVEGDTNVTGDLYVHGTSYLGEITVTADNITVNNINSRDENVSINNSLYVVRDGKVGIGTASPGQLLAVESSTGAGHILTKSSTSTNGILYGADGTDGYFWNYDAGNLYVATSNAIRLQIDSNGVAYFDTNVLVANAVTDKVGIKTNSPSHELNVEGSANVTGDLYVHGTSYLGNLEISANTINVENINPINQGIIINNSLYVNESGNVGIGTASPGDTLHVVGTERFEEDGDANHYLKITPFSDDVTYIDSYGSGTDAIQFRVADAVVNSLRLKANGDVGIGTTSPDHTLHVNSGTSDAIATFESSDYYSDIFIKDNTDAVRLRNEGGIFRVDAGSDGTMNLNVLTDGKVGIGTASPQQELNVEGDVNITGTTHTGGLIGGIKEVTSDSDAVDVEDKTIVWVNTGSGNVTIGGFSNGVEGQIVHVVKPASANSLILEFNEGTAASGDRIITDDGSDLVLDNYGGVTMVYVDNTVGTKYWYILNS